MCINKLIHVYVHILILYILINIIALITEYKHENAGIYIDKKNLVISWKRLYLEKKPKNITSKYYIKYSKNRETLIQGALYYAIKTTMGTNFLQLTRRN